MEKAPLISKHFYELLKNEVKDLRDLDAAKNTLAILKPVLSECNYSAETLRGHRCETLCVCVCMHRCVCMRACLPACLHACQRLPACVPGTLLFIWLSLPLCFCYRCADPGSQSVSEPRPRHDSKTKPRQQKKRAPGTTAKKQQQQPKHTLPCVPACLRAFVHASTHVCACLCACVRARACVSSR